MRERVMNESLDGWMDGWKKGRKEGWMDTTDRLALRLIQGKIEHLLLSGVRKSRAVDGHHVHEQVHGRLGHRDDHTVDRHAPLPHNNLGSTTAGDPGGSDGLGEALGALSRRGLERGAAAEQGGVAGGAGGTVTVRAGPLAGGQGAALVGGGPLARGGRSGGRGAGADLGRAGLVATLRVLLHAAGEEDAAGTGAGSVFGAVAAPGGSV